MSEPITVAAFTKLLEAEQAVRELIAGGVSADKLSIIAKDMQCEKIEKRIPVEFFETREILDGNLWTINQKSS